MNTFTLVNSSETEFRKKKSEWTGTRLFSSQHGSVRTTQPLCVKSPAAWSCTNKPTNKTLLMKCINHETFQLKYLSWKKLSLHKELHTLLFFDYIIFFATAVLSIRHNTRMHSADCPQRESEKFYEKELLKVLFLRRCNWHSENGDSAKFGGGLWTKQWYIQFDVRAGWLCEAGI